MNNPLVTIIVVCYNHVQYVAQCIQSVREQTYDNIEIIVADDCSTDGSITLLDELASKFNFLFLPSKQNQGLNNNILNSLAHANGTYISIIASDDYLASNKIEQQVKYLQLQHKDAVFATGYAVDGHKVGEVIKVNKVFLQSNETKILHYVYQYDWGAPLLQSGLFKKQIFDDLIPLRKEYKSDDWFFLIKCFEMYKTGYLNAPLFYYRLHETNTHKKYWVTYPMRIDVAARLIPEPYKIKAIANIMISQGQYLLNDGKFCKAHKFFIAAVFMDFRFHKIVHVIKCILIFIKIKFNKK